MLGVLLKIVLKNRVADHEIDEICSTYYEAITKWFPSPPSLLDRLHRGNGGPTQDEFIFTLRYLCLNVEE